MMYQAPVTTLLPVERALQEGVSGRLWKHVGDGRDGKETFLALSGYR